MTKPDKHVRSWLTTILVYVAQRQAESRQSRLRRDLLKTDESLADMLAFSGRGE
jgi:hypothetical protein